MQSRGSAGAVAVLLAISGCTAGTAGPWSPTTAEEAGAPASDGDSAATTAPDHGSVPDASLSTHDAGSEEANTPQGHGLTVLQLTSTTSTLTDADTVTFLAIVTDDGGLDTIAGGTLTDDTNATYGGFNTASTKGTYSLTLSWAQIDRIRALDFRAPGMTRTFTATFFDNRANKAVAALSIGFRCGPNGDHDGCHNLGCVDLANDSANCGACGHACSVPDGCLNRACVPPSYATCTANGSQQRTTCAAHCVSIGKTCVMACGGKNAGSIESQCGTGVVSYLKTCSDPVEPNVGFSCCCTT